MIERIRAEIVRDRAYCSGAPAIEVQLPASGGRMGSLSFDLNPEELWELVHALLEIASGGLCR